MKVWYIMIESNHSACTSILIGKNATTDGSIIIGRNEDDKPNCAKHLAFHEEKDIPNNDNVYLICKALGLVMICVALIVMIIQ